MAARLLPLHGKAALQLASDMLILGVEFETRMTWKAGGAPDMSGLLWPQQVQNEQPLLMREVSSLPWLATMS